MRADLGELAQSSRNEGVVSESGIFLKSQLYVVLYSKFFRELTFKYFVQFFKDEVVVIESQIFLERQLCDDFV